MPKIIDFLVETLKKFGIPVTPARIYAILICIFAVVFSCCAIGALPADTDDNLAAFFKNLTNGVLDFTGLAEQTTGDPTLTPTPTATPTETPDLATSKHETWKAHPLGWEPGDPLTYFE